MIPLLKSQTLEVIKELLRVMYLLSLERTHTDASHSSGTNKDRLFKTGIMHHIVRFLFESDDIFVQTRSLSVLNNLLEPGTSWKEIDAM